MTDIDSANGSVPSAQHGADLQRAIKRVIHAPATGIAALILVWAMIAAFALWYSSAGSFREFPYTPNEYIALGTAFLRGQLSLLEQPPPQLAALPDPYDFQQRLNIIYHWDASYYQGKYYLYWGPAPALAFAAVHALTRQPPPAALMATAAYSALVVVFLALLLQLSRLFPHAYGRLPSVLFLLIGFLGLPMLFLLGRPRIYETSILYGQLFLLAGLMGWLAYTNTRRPGWLLFSGTSWGLAVASRYNLVISVSICAAFALFWIGREKGWNRSLQTAGFLLVPLLFCLAGLGFYNYVRFGNPLETGMAYQLTIPMPDPSYSLSYFPSNLYIYLFYPLSTVPKFPFVTSALFDPALLPPWASLVAQQASDHVIFGALPSSPGLWALAFAIPLCALALSRKGRERLSSPFNSQRAFMLAMIASVAAGQFLFLTVFFYGAERYVADFYLSLLLCIAMLIWWLDEQLVSLKWLRIAFWLVIAGLALWTVCIGSFGAFGIPPKVFRASNPALFSQLASYWNDRYSTLIAVLHKAIGLILTAIR